MATHEGIGHGKKSRFHLLWSYSLANHPALVEPKVTVGNPRPPPPYEKKKKMAQ